VGDCLTDALPEHDLALLLLCDYCPRSPADRAHLLVRIRGGGDGAGGRFLLRDAAGAPFDATSPEFAVLAARDP